MTILAAISTLYEAECDSKQSSKAIDEVASICLVVHLSQLIYREAPFESNAERRPGLPGLRRKPASFARPENQVATHRKTQVVRVHITRCGVISCAVSSMFISV
jgi:hypothetical protein